MRPDLDEILVVTESAIRQACRDSVRVDPTIQIFGARDGEVAVLPFGWRNDRERSAVLTALRSTLRFVDTVAYAIAHEVWVTAVDDRGLMPDQPSVVMQGDRPDRHEALMILVVARSGAKKAQMFEIKRDDAGMMVDLVLDKLWSATMDLDGELTRLFEPAHVAGPE